MKSSDSSIDVLGINVQKAATADATLANDRIYFGNHGNGNLNYVYNRNAGPMTFGQRVSGAATEKISFGYQRVGALKANSFWTFTFNGLLQAWIAYPGGLITGAPFETQVDLANAIGAGLWETIPAMYTDASVAALATYAAEHLNASPDFGSNTAMRSGISVRGKLEWSSSMGAALGFPIDNLRQIEGWYGVRFSQLMAIIKSAWGARPGLHRVMAGWAWGNLPASDKFRFQGADLTGSGNATYARIIGADHNAAPNRPIDYADGLSYATYYEGGIITAFNYRRGTYSANDLAALKDAADAYQSGTPSSIAAALAWVDKDIRVGTRNGVLGLETLSSLNSHLYPAWSAVASKYGLPIWNYEGGYQGIAPTVRQCDDIGLSPSATYCGPSGTIAAMLAAYKNSPLFKQVVTDQHNQFLEASPPGSMSAWYVFGGNSQWALFPVDIYSTPFQSYNAIQSYNFLLNRDLDADNK